MGTLTGQITLISGGLGDIGRAIARELAKQGADIALCGLAEPDVAADFLAELRGLGRRASYNLVDVTNAQQVSALMRSVETNLGIPTLIIPNAAQVTQAECRSITPAQWSREMRVNLDGAFHVAQAAALALLAHRRPGRIVFIGSWAAHRVHAHIPAYCVAKAGLRMLSQCMAAEFAAAGILVNEVAPGIVDAGVSREVMGGNSVLREAIRERIPVREFVTAEEVARTVRFLCEPNNHQMTGSVIVQDGGLSLLTPRP